MKRTAQVLVMMLIAIVSSLLGKLYPACEGIINWCGGCLAMIAWDAIGDIIEVRLERH